jgi:hypothetical protein
MEKNTSDGVVTTLPASADQESRTVMTAPLPFGYVAVGKRFAARGSQWEKRSDGLGADLIDRNGCISFIGGRRHIETFADDEKVEVPWREAIDAVQAALRVDMQAADDDYDAEMSRVAAIA